MRVAAPSLDHISAASYDALNGRPPRRTVQATRASLLADATTATFLWGWFYLSTILDDYSRYIAAWKLCTTMQASDMTETLK